MQTKAKKPKKRTPRAIRDKWQPMYLVRLYRMARGGMADIDMAKELGVDRKTLWNWQQEKTEVRETLALARQERKERDSLPDWIYSHMSPELRGVWDRITEFEGKSNAIVLIEQILEDSGLRVRQELFLHALCMLRFSPSLALAKVNITKRELDKWLGDPEFSRLMDEIQWHKANFFEEHLVSLVEQNNPAAVIFANKTVNKDRGYVSRTETDVRVSGGVVVGVLDLAELMPYLDDGLKLGLLEAIRQREADSLKTLNPPSPAQIVSQQIAEAANIPVPEENEP